VDSKEAPDNTTIAGQVATLKTTKIMLMAAVVAAIADDTELLKEIVWRAYHLMLPILSLEQSAPYVVQALLFLQQAMLIIPKGNFDEAMHSVFACLSYQITMAGRDLAEVQGVNFGLFGVTADDDEESGFMTMQQRAVFDVWQSLGSFKGLSEEQIVRAVNVPPPPPPPPLEDGEAEPEEATPRLGSLYINHEIGKSLSSPEVAMEKLKEQFGSDPTFSRFFIMVCHSAIASGEVELARTFMQDFEFQASDVTPFVRKVLGEDAEDFVTYVGVAEEEEEGEGEEKKEEKEKSKPTPSLSASQTSIVTTITNRNGDEQEEGGAIGDSFPTEEEKQSLMVRRRRCSPAAHSALTLFTPRAGSRRRRGAQGALRHCRLSRLRKRLPGGEQA
jgi:hypothetical protein